MALSPHHKLSSAVPSEHNPYHNLAEFNMIALFILSSVYILLGFVNVFLISIVIFWVFRLMCFCSQALFHNRGLQIAINRKPKTSEIEASHKK